MTLETHLRALLADVAREVVREELAKLSHHEDYLSPARAASVAEVAPGTIRRWIREGRIAAHHAGRGVRVSRSELERFLRTDRRPMINLSPEELAARDFG
jgi:excisionase family DNA binding protein